MGKLDAGVAGQVIDGVARGCRNNGCALIGGETAEMPGLYQARRVRLGRLHRRRRGAQADADRRGDPAGDVLLGLPSNGLHTNGYSLARKLLFEVARRPARRRAWPMNCCKVHRSYLKPIRALIDARMLKGAAHITGGGITDNTPRILPKGLAARVDLSSWTIPPIFEELREIGNLDLADYRRTFNLGIGMILVVAKRNLAKGARDH